MVGIDWSDGGGMNLLDIRTKEWNTDLLAAAGEGLAEKLGAPLSPNTVVGHVSEYMQERSVQKLVIGKHNSIQYTAFSNSTEFINTSRISYLVCQSITKKRTHHLCNASLYMVPKTMSKVNLKFEPQGLLNCWNLNLH